MNRLIETWLTNRGFDYDTIKMLNDPRHDDLKSLDELCADLHVVHDNGDKIVILPDFDMDGIMSGVVGFAGMSELGFNVSLFRPDPSEGYGFTPKTIGRLISQFPDVKAIITCDTGITCYAGVAAAMESGIKVFVTDHHVQEMNSSMPLYANVIVDPNRLDETYKNKGICGAHVFWQVIQRYADTYATAFIAEQCKRLRVFAGIGTISDVMPLVYENRDLVRDACGICRLVYGGDSTFFIDSMTGTVPYVRAFRGLNAVLHVFAEAGKISSGDDITEEFFGYYLAPMFNSVKRMNGNMDLAFGVFFGNDPVSDANALFALNEQRKAAVAAYFAEMMNSSQPFAPYIYLSDAQPGILGLLATKVETMTGEPVMVVTEDGGHYHGSGRSPEWYPAIELIGGKGFHIAGHQGAFGVGITDKRELKSLWAYLVQSVAEQKAKLPAQPEFAPDIVISSKPGATTGIDIPCFAEYLHELRSFAPFGRGFEAPLVVFDFMPSEAEWTTMGSMNQHLKGTFEHGFELLMWNAADKLDDIRNATEVRCYGALGMNEFMGRRSINFVANEVECL